MTPYPKEVPLRYTIAYATPHSGRYTAENILVDNPSDQNSRWSGAHQGNKKQWLLLRLESLAVLRRITFGKFTKPHPCNMKEFKVYIGLTEENMIQVHHGGLKNTAEAETFPIQHVNNMSVTVPTRYVKVEPLAAHGQSFHISIWHLAFSGHIEPEYIERVRVTYEEHREEKVLRHILKHLRQRRLLTPFKSIAERSGLRLEHPLVSKLHASVVLQGDWKGAEALLTNLADKGLFTKFLHSCQPQAVWTRILGTDSDGDIPSPRGGHAMCMDHENQIIYLFGGWDGQKSLDDFWAYYVLKDKWEILSHGTSNELNAPGARSCHKMAFDSKTGSIYLLGRLDDSDVKVPSSAANSTQSAIAGPPLVQSGNLPAHITGTVSQQSPLRQQITPPDSQTATPVITPAKTYSSEFYRYQTRGLDAGKWVFLSFDTASSGGPPLVFDHQMVIDSESQILYVFGGRIVDGDWETAKYSGLYSYNMRLSKWKLLQGTDVATSTSSHAIIPPRFGHSMVLEPKTKRLYIFGGQREQRYLSDMYVYDLNTNTATEIYSNFTTSGGPDPCFTQRAVIDPILKEIYVFCGLTRSSTNSSQNTSLKSNPSNWVYRYDPKPGKWSQILRHPESPSKEVPLPRFAHQVVYHPASRSVFLHGGNAGGLMAIEKEKDREQDKDQDRNGGPGLETTEAADSSQQLPVATPSGSSSSAPPAAHRPTQEGSGTASASGRPSAPVGADTQPPAVAVTKEKRLDDFWRMELRRPQVDEVIRRAKFLIRRQQFRELCETASPVQALQFLQTEVSGVVDHKDQHETEEFRSLLTHLLAPPTQPSPFIPTPSQTKRSASQDSGITEDDLEFPEDAARRNIGKRRQSNESGEWTNVLPGEPDQGNGDSALSTAVGTTRSSAEVLRGIVDPLELPFGHSSSQESTGGSAVNQAVNLSSERYKQRTDLFTSLLKFVASDEKEPGGELLDFVMGRDSLFDGQVM